ncbi:MAG: peroxidase-related enzyme [Calditrichia bacterium]
MPWISVIEENEASEELLNLYEQIIKKRGNLSNIMKVQSHNPPAMQAHLDLYMTLMFRKSGLSREQREMIAVIVSRANRCQYCLNHHSEALNFYWKDKRRLQNFLNDFRSSDISEPEKAMLEYALKLTLHPNQILEEEVIHLRENGFHDGDILDINMITSYFNFVNRLANGLGVEFDPREVSGYKY